LVTLKVRKKNGKKHLPYREGGGTGRNKAVSRTVEKKGGGKANFEPVGPKMRGRFDFSAEGGRGLGSLKKGGAAHQLTDQNLKR